ncbi:MAG TPA: ribosome recycling factor [Myxococcota bacterium]|nr:ribosome recycling factor [Myxococcota bacterium]
MIDDVIKDLTENQNKAIDAFKRELGRVRTGRANLAVLEPVRVEYYGSKVPLNQVASLSIPDARQIVIKPWEKALIQDIEKAIHVAEIGLNPQSDGEIIRLPIPSLTEERRRELVKQCRKLSENAKVSIRNHRRDGNEFLKELEKSKDISEDDKKRGFNRIQKETDKAIEKIGEVFSEKEKEIMEV